MQYFTYLQTCPKGHETTYQKFLKLAEKLDSTVEIYQVRAGFTVKKHAPEMGNCYDNFEYLQNWNFNDEPTKDCIVFWIPKLLPKSLNKSVNEQEKLLAKYGCKLESASLQIGLILAHLQRTGEKLPLNFTRTSTCYSDGYRLNLYWSQGRLNCAYWHWGEYGYSFLAVAALGVELLDSRTLGTLEVRDWVARSEFEEFKSKVEKVLKI